MKKALLVALMVAATKASASIFPYPSPAVNEAGLTYNQTYAFDLGPSYSNVAATVTYSSATFASQSIASGQTSAGTITMTDIALLSTATASNTLTVASTSGITGAIVTLMQYQIQNGRDWRSTSSVNTTAASIATALAKIPFVNVSRLDNVITVTAVSPGTSFFNGLSFKTSKPSALVVATPYFTGGRDAGIAKVNGVPFRQAVDWGVGASSATAATSLAAAINANARLVPYVLATPNSPSLGVITLTSKKVGASMNFSLASSVPSGMAVSGAKMTGGTNASYSLGGTSVHAPAHGLTNGLAVRFDQGTLPVAPLADQATYYVAVLGTDDIALADTQEHALAGTYIALTSSMTVASALTSSLVPLDIAGTPGFYWERSSNGTSWTDLTNVMVSSVTITSYTSPYATAPFSFGKYAYRYLRLHVIAPTAGGLKLRLNIGRPN